MTDATNTYVYSKTSRNELLDEFLTPIELIEACFEQAIFPLFDGKRVPEYILDVGANDGRWGKIAKKYFPNSNIYGVEIMDMPDFPDEYTGWFHDDFIVIEAYLKDWGKYLPDFDLIIGNPPFTVKEPNGFDENGKQKYKVKYKAEDFVRKALSLLDSNYGILAFLLRSNFRHSIERYWLDKDRTQPGLFQTNIPRSVWDCTLRPSFYKEDSRTEQYGTKQTNAHDYSLFMWDKLWTARYYVGTQLDWQYKE